MVLTQKIAPKCSSEASSTAAPAVTSTTSTSKSCRRKIAFHPTLGKQAFKVHIFWEGFSEYMNFTNNDYFHEKINIETEKKHAA